MTGKTGEGNKAGNVHILFTLQHPVDLRDGSSVFSEVCPPPPFSARTTPCEEATEHFQQRLYPVMLLEVVLW